jgi:signal peptidase II
MLAHHDRHQPGRLHRPHATRCGSGSQTGNASCKIDFRVGGEDMSFWIAAFLLIPLADQAIKARLRQRLGDRVVSLGPLGSVRVIDAPIWWARGGLRPTPVMLWIAWLAGAGALVALATRLPGCEWCAALLLGGSLSHMIETSRRGRVCDYLCLRFWPAFNLADAAISIGTVGFIIQVISAWVNLLY